MRQSVQKHVEILMSYINIKIILVSMNVCWAKELPITMLYHSFQYLISKNHFLLTFENNL